MARYLFLMCSIFFIYNTSAQDTILLKNQTQIKGKVIKVGGTEIEYNKAELPDGPAYTVAKSDVLKITYKNGYVESFSAPNPKKSISLEDLLALKNMTINEAVKHFEKRGYTDFKNNEATLSLNSEIINVLGFDFNNCSIDKNVEKVSVIRFWSQYPDGVKPDYSRLTESITAKYGKPSEKKDNNGYNTYSWNLDDDHQIVLLYPGPDNGLFIAVFGRPEKLLLEEQRREQEKKDALAKQDKLLQIEINELPGSYHIPTTLENNVSYDDIIEKYDTYRREYLGSLRRAERNILLFTKALKELNIFYRVEKSEFKNKLNLKNGMVIDTSYFAKYYIALLPGNINDHNLSINREAIVFSKDGQYYFRVGLMFIPENLSDDKQAFKEMKNTIVKTYGTIKKSFELTNIDKQPLDKKVSFKINYYDEEEDEREDDEYGTVTFIDGDIKKSRNYVLTAPILGNDFENILLKHPALIYVREEGNAKLEIKK